MFLIGVYKGWVELFFYTWSFLKQNCLIAVVSYVNYKYVNKKNIETISKIFEIFTNKK